MPSNTLTKLIADSPEMLTCKYGKHDAIGFRGTRAQIDAAFNLFSNYGQHYSLRWAGDNLAFISTPLSKVRAAIKAYLRTNILLAREVEVADYYDEATDQWTELRDDEKAEALAEQDADAFMQTIKTESFVAE